MECSDCGPKFGQSTRIQGCDSISLSSERSNDLGVCYYKLVDIIE